MTALRSSNKLHSTLHQITNKSAIYLFIFSHCKFAACPRMFDASAHRPYCAICHLQPIGALSVATLRYILTPIKVDGRAHKEWAQIFFSSKPDIVGTRRLVNNLRRTSQVKCITVYGTKSEKCIEPMRVGMFTLAQQTETEWQTSEQCSFTSYHCYLSLINFM